MKLLRVRSVPMVIFVSTALIVLGLTTSQSSQHHTIDIEGLTKNDPILRITVPADWSQRNGRIFTGRGRIDLTFAHFVTKMNDSEIRQMLKPIVDRTPPENLKRIEFGAFVGVSAVKVAKTESDETEVYFRLADGKHELSIMGTCKGGMSLAEYIEVERAVRTARIIGNGSRK